MTTQHGLLILHLSDLHFGNHNRFADRDVAKLGKAFFRAVEHARTRAEIPVQVQLVIISGDVTETADEVEFEQAWQFLDALSGEIGLEHTRFVFAPGNHDVSWPLCEIETIQQKLKKFPNDELRRRMDGVKFQFYDAMLTRIYGMPLADVPGRRQLAAGGCLHSSRADGRQVLRAACISTTSGDPVLVHVLERGFLGTGLSTAFL
jgi:3',5'-cyclic AMP phosphodiesterase CpdA